MNLLSNTAFVHCIGWYINIYKLIKNLGAPWHPLSLMRSAPAILHTDQLPIPCTITLSFQILCFKSRSTSRLLNFSFMLGLVNDSENHWHYIEYKILEVDEPSHQDLDGHRFKLWVPLQNLALVHLFIFHILKQWFLRQIKDDGLPFYQRSKVSKKSSSMEQRTWCCNFVAREHRSRVDRKKCIEIGQGSKMWQMFVDTRGKTDTWQH